MAAKFKGELDELKALIAGAGIEGAWKEEAGGKHSFKSKADGVLNWWPGTGTLQFQGQADGKAALEAALAGDMPAAAAAPVPARGWGSPR